MSRGYFTFGEVGAPAPSEANSLSDQRAGMVARSVLRYTFDHQAAGMVVEHGAVTMHARQVGGMSSERPTAVGTMAIPEHRSGLVAENKLTGVVIPEARPGPEIEQLTFDLTHRRGAASITEVLVGDSGWINESNAAGEPNGGFATLPNPTGVANRFGTLVGAHDDFVGKSSLTITAVRLRVYIRVAGTVANNAEVAPEYDLGNATAITILETITGNVDSIASPRVYDLTAHRAWSWTDLNNFRSRCRALKQPAENWTVELDSMQLEVIATRTDVL